MINKPVYSFFKRLFDIFASAISLLLLSVFLLIIALAIKIDSKGPVLFKQKRVGKNKALFLIIKFRSMYVGTSPDSPTHQLSNPANHITKVGRFIRKTSLDELPQLLNILMGQMSFVGPRPALWNQYDLVTERDKYDANKVKPGLTGLAQISGRDELDIVNKAKLDGLYIKKRGLFYDLWLIIKTVFKVITHEGFAEGGDKERKK